MNDWHLGLLNARSIFDGLTVKPVAVCSSQSAAALILECIAERRALHAMLWRTVDALDRARHHDYTNARAISDAAHALLGSIDIADNKG